jgi:hypothetical protein
MIRWCLTISTGTLIVMRPRDIALAVAVTAIRGVNFVVIETGLDHFPPLEFNALRFAPAAKVPA